MKTILYTISTILLLSVLTSCSDFLEQAPKSGLVAEEYWNNKNELHKVMMGAYAVLADMDVHLFLNGELRADMLQEGGGLTLYEFSNYYNFYNVRDIMVVSVLPTNKFLQWDKFYKVINLCNHVIKYAPIIQERDASFSDYYRDAYISEAMALRSLMYFYLVRIYKDVPYITVPTESDHVDLFPEKISGKAILDSIMTNMVALENVEKMSDYYGDDVSTIGRMNRRAAYALIADIALWRYDYDLALSYIEKIESSEQYILLPNNDWFNLFSDGNTYESIFEIQYDAANSQGNQLYDLTSNSNYKYFFVSSYAEKLFVEDKFGNKSKERTRTEGTVLKDGNYYRIYKYIGAAPNSDAIVGFLRSSPRASANFIIYRYADVLLMKAEALIQKAAPEYDEALEIINMLRIRAFAPTISASDFSSSQIAAEEIILEERALELAYEGKRWFDLMRYGRRNNYAQKDAFIEKIVENAPPSQRLIIASKLRNPESWYLPIYQNEIDNNVNLEQNPYYEGSGL